MSKSTSNNLMRFWFALFGHLILVTFSGYSMAEGPAEFEIPFDLPMAANTRVVNVAQYSIGDLREANGSLATRDTARSVISFYERELEAVGFNVFSKTDNDDRLSIAAKRDTGDFFSLSSSRRGYVEVEEGEIELRILVRYAP